MPEPPLAYLLELLTPHMYGTLVGTCFDATKHPRNLATQSNFILTPVEGMNNYDPLSAACIYKKFQAFNNFHLVWKGLSLSLSKASVMALVIHSS